MHGMAELAVSDSTLTRFAPAPTGHLHLGHVVNAIYVWGLAHAGGGRVLLRIEDHDRQRARAAFERSLLDDLDWLGFQPDVYPTDAYRAGACEARQSEREAIYRAAVQPLIDQGLVYGCTCSRRDIEDLHRVGVPASGELCYPGTCRDRGIPLADDVGWRLQIDPGVEDFVDLLCGAQSQDPSRQCGDLLLRDRLGNWTYQLAVVVDDLAQEVNLVVRGMDLLASTGRQIRLARMLGRAQPPQFAHHALVMKSAEQKLSKSDGDTGISALRDAGWTARRVIGHAAFIAGLIPDERPLDANAVASLFA
jgi:glutamyl-tRNA synthetase/glutamyl-Q tRNA(Asp) synthetase